MKTTSFQVASRIDGNAAVLYPKGYLNNLSGESLVAECNAFVERGIRKIILNLGETDFINSIGISLLLHIIESLREVEGTLCFSDLSKIHRDTFEMLGLTKFMLVFPDELEALQYLHSRSA